MAFVQIPGGLWIPRSPGDLGALASASGVVLNADGEKAGLVFAYPETGEVETVEFGLTAVTNTDDGLRVSLQDLSGGLPDGTQDQYRVIDPVAIGWNAPGRITDDGTDNGTRRSVTRGEHGCFVVEFESFVASDSVRVRTFGLNDSSRKTPPYGCADTGGGWTKSGLLTHAAIKYSDGLYYPIGNFVYPYNQTFNSWSYASDNDPDEFALRFKLPAPMRLGGFWMACDVDWPVDVVLYDAGDSVVETLTLQNTEWRAAATAPGFWYFSTPLDLDANAVYRLAVKPTTANGIILGGFKVESNARLGGVDGGIEWYASYRTDGGAWTDQDSWRPHIGLIFDGVSDGAGAGDVPSGWMGQYPAGIR